MFHQILHKHLFVVSVFLSMSDTSPYSPLSLNSSSNGSGSNMQDSVRSTHSSAQSLNPSMLDGFEHHNSNQPHEPLWSTFSDALKFGVGGHGSGVNPTAFQPAVPEPVLHQADPIPSGGEVLSLLFTG